MKKQILKKWLGSILVLFIATTLFSTQEAQAESPFGVSFQVFYDELAPYGDWVQDQNHGYIWLPFAEQGFHPYGSNGHWAMTSYGNTWVSYYDWGWAPFHYGRWYFDNFYQSWAWVPGYDWGPAWVNWRTGGGYYGWAPLAPILSVSIGFNIPNSYFVFIPRNRIYHQYAHRYFAPYRNRVRIYNQTTIINNTVVINNNNYIGGPNRREIERATRRAVPVYQVQASDRAGRAAMSRNSISLYRPTLESSPSRNAQARPSRVLEASEARTTRLQTTDRSVSNSSRSPNVNSGNLNTPASRSDRGIVRSNGSTQESRSFESRPLEENRSSTSPSRQTQARPQVGISGSRSTNPARVQATPEVHRSERIRTQPAQPQVRSSQGQRTASPRSEVRPNPAQRSHNPQPAVRTAPEQRSTGVRSAPQQRSNTEVGTTTRSSPARATVSSPSSNSRSAAPQVARPTQRESSPTGSSSRSSTGRTVRPRGN